MRSKPMRACAVGALRLRSCARTGIAASVASASRAMAARRSRKDGDMEPAARGQSAHCRRAAVRSRSTAVRDDSGPPWSIDMILVTGTLHARADTLDELRQLALEHVARSRAEAGCLEH